ncbi:hypothetical protein [Parasedimentitalea huanghaiensis]|uniref:Uncharacterized protein n=1 Tax=Parasedimentitalea huanghaiensis TaxID=2682100 RepID=A0A6L6WDN5_9RHOB|nr:hypothetical protein [Zongyanglinia huanghaiensis]MVO15906.1 hypothetical protein [Zongyanglinia huanghaiensis]
MPDVQGLFKLFSRYSRAFAGLGVAPLRGVKGLAGEAVQGQVALNAPVQV